MHERRSPRVRQLSAARTDDADRVACFMSPCSPKREPLYGHQTPDGLGKTTGSGTTVPGSLLK